MTTGVKLFAASAAFGAVTAGVYWFVSYERAGTILLSFMAVSPLVVASYLLLAGRGSTVPADRADATPAEAAGETFGPLPSRSGGPALLAVGSAVLAVGLVFGIWLVLIGALIAAVAAIGLLREPG